MAVRALPPTPYRDVNPAPKESRFSTAARLSFKRLKNAFASSPPTSPTQPPSDTIPTVSPVPMTNAPNSSTAQSSGNSTNIMQKLLSRKPSKKSSSIRISKAKERQHSIDNSALLRTDSVSSSDEGNTSNANPLPSTSCPSSPGKLLGALTLPPVAVADRSPCFSTPDIRSIVGGSSPFQSTDTGIQIDDRDVHRSDPTNLPQSPSSRGTTTSSSSGKQTPDNPLTLSTSSSLKKRSNSATRSNFNSIKRKITFHNLMQFKNNSSPPSSNTHLRNRRCASLRVNPNKRQAWNDYHIDFPIDKQPSGNRRRILVAVDGSANAERAFRWYLDYMMEPLDRILLVHIADPILPMAAGLAPMRSVDTSRDNAACLRISEFLLQRYLDRAGENDARNKCEAHVYISRRPADALVMACRMHRADAMVIGSRGDGAGGGSRGIRGYFLGSVSNSVLRNSPVPVTLVPPYQVDPSGDETAQFHHRCRSAAAAKKSLQDAELAKKSSQDIEMAKKSSQDIEMAKKSFNESPTSKNKSIVAPSRKKSPTDSPISRKSIELNATRKSPNETSVSRKNSNSSSKSTKKSSNETSSVIYQSSTPSTMKKSPNETSVSRQSSNSSSTSMKKSPNEISVSRKSSNSSSTSTKKSSNEMSSVIYQSSTPSSTKKSTQLLPNSRKCSDNSAPNEVNQSIDESTQRKFSV